MTPGSSSARRVTVSRLRVTCSARSIAGVGMIRTSAARRPRCWVSTVALAGIGGWFAAQGDDNSERTGGRTEGLGVFAPISGWIAYTNNRGHGPGIWAVEPLPSDDPAREGVYGKDGSTPVAWSSDGTELLITRQGATMIQRASDPARRRHRDGGPVRAGCTGHVFSPDGRRVVYTSFGVERPPSGLYVVDADGGPSEVLVDSAGTFLGAPTFSPDGTRIAYVDERGENQDKHRVWVVNADGGDPRVIVAEETLNNAAVFGLAWSPTGDAIALGLLRTEARGRVREASVFTFAPDGSRFTRVIENGVSPTWSANGPRIAFSHYRRGDVDSPRRHRDRECQRNGVGVRLRECGARHLAPRPLIDASACHDEVEVDRPHPGQREVEEPTEPGGTGRNP